MKKIYIVLFLITSTIIANSQAKSKQENIKELLQLTGSGNLSMQIMQTMINSYKKNLTNVPDEFWDEFMKEASPDDFIKMIIPIYDKYYTDEDILQLITFYESPVGKKVIATLPKIMQESFGVGEAWGKTLGDSIMNRLKSKGYL